ncbi:nucleotidyltransferase [Romboutsia ilealis]|uniref:tRNA(Met) cytidine acetate ligase n=1 Tax=Romboutsia faecis TaxID=2764597 RepID=A0ABR7JN63_9FIRM|nr:nucleotidyltransferase [Romboutsia faecis]MBC5996036.1 nucleotidyltransferase [Romboutsia faecis]MRN23236.1 nucleotidyltransferase [Romboutsia ilealis]
MNILGLVVEYNPFHNGHLYHLLKSKEITKATHTVAIMSGNFLQRGEPALFDKYTRARAAVENDVDLVIELPTLFACQSAEIFSHGAVATLNSLNCINSICFGSEVGDIEILYTISKILVNEPNEFKTSLKKYLNDGMLFPTARSNALFDYINENNLVDISKDELLSILNSSNNILGIEYIKSLLKLKSNIKPYTITRINSEYNSESIDSSICSATAIRKALKNTDDVSFASKVVPLPTYNILNTNIEKNFNPIFDEMFFDILSSIILRDSHDLDKYFDVNEGIENKIYQSIFTSSNLEELHSLVKSKRYTLTKIKRTLNNILLGITKDDMALVKDMNYIPYIRVLAFNDKGREILKTIKNNSEINIINKFSKISFAIDDAKFKTLIDYDIKASNIYNMIYYKNNRQLLKGPMDFYMSPTYVK